MSKNDLLVLSFTHSAQIHLNKLVQKVEQVLYIKLRNLMENLQLLSNKYIPVYTYTIYRSSPPEAFC